MKSKKVYEEFIRRYDDPSLKKEMIENSMRLLIGTSRIAKWLGISTARLYAIHMRGMKADGTIFRLPGFSEHGRWLSTPLMLLEYFKKQLQCSYNTQGHIEVDDLKNTEKS